MTVRQLAEASCTLACFESFLGQNGIRITQREMKKMRPDICGEVDDEARCVYTHHYAAVGQAFGFTCSEITGPDVLFPCYPTSAILMGTDVFYTPTPHSLLWTYINKSNGVGFAMNPAAEHYFRFHVSTLNQYTYGLVNAPITRYAPPNSRVEVVEKENLTSGTLIWLQVRPDPAPPHLVRGYPYPALASCNCATAERSFNDLKEPSCF